MELEIVALFLRLLFACYKSSSEIIIINGTYEAVFPFTFKRIELKNFSNKFHLNWFNGICEQQQQQLDSSNNNMKERNSKRLEKKVFTFRVPLSRILNTNVLVLISTHSHVLHM